MRNEQYCLHCFALIPLEAHSCPNCGRSPSSASDVEFGDRLLHALTHPLSEVRMRAIVALGWRGEERAANALADCALRRPVDVTEGLAVVRSLAALSRGPLRQAALARLADQHLAGAVRKAARRALDARKRAEPEGGVSGPD